MKKSVLIVFDIDGTLSDSVEGHQASFREALKDIGVAVINAEFKSFKHHTDSYIAKEIFEQSQVQAFSEDKVKAFESSLSTKVKALKFEEINGAKALIDQLRVEPVYAFCFSTGSLRRAAEHKLKSIGIDFEDWQLVASDELYEREQIVNRAINNSIRHYGVDGFERIISLGDGLWDLLTAKNLDVEFIGIGEENKEVLFAHGAKIVLRDLSSLELDFT